MFCVNDGTCKKNGRPGCHCPAGYTGFSCEFYVGDSMRGKGETSQKPQVDDMPVEEVPECSLDCGGHGVCAHGMKDSSALGHATYADGFSQTHDNLQHCVCEEGYTGIYCDKKISLCPDEDTFCLHGAKCHVDPTGSSICDCRTAERDKGEHYFGQSCEFLVTSVCSLGEGVDDFNPRSSFCVNDGICKAEVSRNEEYVSCSL